MTKKQFYLLLPNTTVINRCMMVPCAMDPIWLEHIGCWRVCATTETYTVIGCQMPSRQIAEMCDALGVGSFTDGITELFRLGIGDCLIGYTGSEATIIEHHPELGGTKTIDTDDGPVEVPVFTYFRISGDK